jgi:hypothetical protein
MLVVAVAMFGAATPALADPAAPTTYRSEVTSVTPSPEGFSAEVAGGDAFLQISADPGVTVLVPGYQGEPFLRIDAEGSVEANRNSPSYWINNDRYGIAPVPASASAAAAPDWIAVGSGGTYAWHDHRIHWMSPLPPPGVTEDQQSTVQTWTVQVEVGLIAVQIDGVLEWIPPISPLPWIGVAGAVALAGMLLLPVMSLGIGAALATIFGLVQAASSPLGFWSEWLSVAPPLIVVGLVVFLIRTTKSGLAASGTGAVLMGVWLALRVGYFTNPVLPVPIDPNLARGLIAATLGLTVAAVLRTYRRLSRM